MSDEQDESPSNPDIHFEPIVKLPLVETKTLEEDEEALIKLRARLFRYDHSEQPPEWKDRGTGEVKLLKHISKGSVRIVMRREKTLKICANHYVYPNMELKPNCNSDRAWVWSTTADFTDEKPKPELLAIRFANAENAQKFKTAFEDAKAYVKDQENNSENQNVIEGCNVPTDKVESDGDVVEKLKELSVKEPEESSCKVQEGKPSCKTKDEEHGS